ncbi:MAG: hypothetical protein KDA67_06740 [Rhodobacteraceae bacterium]|nr:hypothetical protein [Paracoccaceae bacterium]
MLNGESIAVEKSERLLPVLEMQAFGGTFRVIGSLLASLKLVFPGKIIWFYRLARSIPHLVFKAEIGRMSKGNENVSMLTFDSAPITGLYWPIRSGLIMDIFSPSAFSPVPCSSEPRKALSALSFGCQSGVYCIQQWRSVRY